LHLPQDRPRRVAIPACVEDEHAIAFLDKGQVTRDHALVVPRRLAADTWTLSEDEAHAVMRSVHRVARLLREELDLRGLNITQANGTAAWQEIFHYRVHLIQRYRDDGFSAPWRSTSPSEDLLSEIQRHILDQ
jgi:histidine triad (HIT) family protein